MTKSNDPRIDAYIARSAPFAQPILQHLRRLIHKAVPDVEETMKWSFPHFDHHGIMCSMAAFKEHCTFGFWKASVMEDPHGILQRVGETAMGQFGRITSLDDLPDDAILLAYLREAARLNAEGVKRPAKPKQKRKPLKVPGFFKEALAKNAKALRAFEQFTPSHKREYVEWVTEAKTEATRTKRLATSIKWIATGKRRNWKYERK